MALRRLQKLWALEPVSGPDRRRTIATIACAARLATIALCVVADLALPDHHAQGVTLFHGDGDSSWVPYWLKQPFTRWDAAHLLGIARDGYSGEMSHAFFPLYPLVVASTAAVLRADLVLVAVVLSNVSFVAAAVILLELGQSLLADRHLAFQAATIFCVSPASVFFSSCYTESFFAMLTFAGLWQLQQRHTWAATACFAAATAARANGVTAAGFVAFYHIRILASKWGGERFPRGSVALTLVSSGSLAAVQCGLVVAPFLAADWYGRYRLCGTERGTEPNEYRAWCHSWLPSLYSHVQREHWNVGFLRYWTIKQIPNFLLAAPVLVLSARGLYANVVVVAQKIRQFIGRDSSASAAPLSGALPVAAEDLTPHLLHWAALSFTVLFVAHVQIVTRLLGAACPVFYWHMASILRGPRTMDNRNKGSGGGGRRSAEFIAAWVLLYATLGPVLHCNYLPWT